MSDSAFNFVRYFCFVFLFVTVRAVHGWTEQTVEVFNGGGVTEVNVYKYMPRWYLDDSCTCTYNVIQHVQNNVGRSCTNKM